MSPCKQGRANTNVVRAVSPSANPCLFPLTGCDQFFDVANQPEVKALLPVVTKDIGDGWVCVSKSRARKPREAWGQSS